jgi:ABC-type uncharacterized transport system permease subunit
VAVPEPKHWEMLGHRDSSQTVWRLALLKSAFSWWVLLKTKKGLDIMRILSQVIHLG